MVFTVLVLLACGALAVALAQEPEHPPEEPTGTGEAVGHPTGEPGGEPEPPPGGPTSGGEPGQPSQTGEPPPVGTGGQGQLQGTSGGGIPSSQTGQPGGGAATGVPPEIQEIAWMLYNGEPEQEILAKWEVAVTTLAASDSTLHAAPLIAETYIEALSISHRQMLELLMQKWGEQLSSVGDDAQLANVDLQNMLQKQQQTIQMLSNISKTLHDTAMAVIRNIGG